MEKWKQKAEGVEGASWCNLWSLPTMTIPPDCSAVHMLMMGAMPMVVPWKYTPLKEEK